VQQSIQSLESGVKLITMMVEMLFALGLQKGASILSQRLLNFLFSNLRDCSDRSDYIETTI